MLLDPSLRFKSLSYYSEAEKVKKAVEDEGKLLASEVLTEDSSQPPAKTLKAKQIHVTFRRRMGTMHMK